MVLEISLVVVVWQALTFCIKLFSRAVNWQHCFNLISGDGLLIVWELEVVGFFDGNQVPHFKEMVLSRMRHHSLLGLGVKVCNPRNNQTVLGVLGRVSGVVVHHGRRFSFESCSLTNYLLVFI